MPTNSAIPQPTGRVVVLCFDGTGNQFNAANTNVVKFYSLLDKCCPLEQNAYYQPGVGTYINPGVVSPALAWIAKIADEAVAWYLNEHVMEGYKYLMQNYQAGDKICLFGFSRGAYTARALAGFLYKIGLLERDNDEQVPFAFKLYKREDNDGIGLANKFKQTFCIPVTIDFLGVWDTVASVGIIYGRGLPFTSANDAVRVFRHALSLDEHRARFQPNLFQRPSPQDASDHVQLDSFPDVQEVWFTGCHSDVGGSAVPDTVSPQLSNISLQWMVKQVILSGCGIRFDIAALELAGVDNSIIQLLELTVEERLAAEVKAASQSPQTTRYWEGDVLAGVNDELKKKPSWWLAEFLLTKFIWQDPRRDWTWRHKWRLGLGCPRVIRDLHPYFHFSVKRKTEVDPKYIEGHKAKLMRGAEVRYTD